MLFKYSPPFYWLFLMKYNKNFVDIKEMPPSKILQGRCEESGASFHGRNKFFQSVFFNTAEISAQIQKPTKY